LARRKYFNIELLREETVSTVESMRGKLACITRFLPLGERAKMRQLTAQLDAYISELVQLLSAHEIHIVICDRCGTLSTHWLFFP
jgi:hypothetical protein